jgi:hypothetical protein
MVDGTCDALGQAVEGEVQSTGQQRKLLSIDPLRA